MASRLLSGAWALAATAAFLAGTAHAGPTLERIQSTGTLTLGYRAGGPPFSYETGNGQVIGYAIDVCQRLAATIQQQLRLPRLAVRYVPVTTAERIAAVRDGRIDLECASTTNTKARREQVAFGLTYFYTGARLLVREGEGIHSLADMKGKTLALVKGTTGEQVLQARQRRGGGGWQVKVVESARAGVAALEQGTVDAVLQDDVQLASLARQSSRKLSLTGVALSIEPLSLMYSKDDAELGQLVQARMKQLYRDGDMERLYRQWFQQPLPARNYSLDIQLGPLLRDNFLRPSAYVTDWAVL